MTLIELVSSNPFTTLAGALISAFVGHRLHVRRQEKKAAREWYSEAKGHLSNLQQAGEKATRYRDGVNPTRLKDGLDGLDEDMMMLANDEQERVDDAARQELGVIAAYATALATLADKSRSTDALEFVRQVQSDAIENYDGEYDMDDFEELFAGFDFDEFAEAAADKDVEINDEKAEELRSRFSEESLEAGRPTTIEEALSIPIEKARDAFESEGAVEMAVDDSTEMFVKMVVNLATDVHERMDERQNRV